MTGRRRNLADLLSPASDTEAELQETQAGPAAAASLLLVPLEQLAGNPENPREDDLDVVELAASFAETGQLQTVAVVSRAVYLAHYPQHEDAIGAALYVVINGNRRLEAANLAELPGLEVSVRDNLTGDAMDDAVIIENVHRQSLNPLREAQFLARMVERHGSQTKLAKRIAKTQAYVSQRLSLLRLHPDLQALVLSEELGIKLARTLAKIESQDDQLAAWQKLKDDNPVLSEDPDADALEAEPEPETHNPAIGEDGEAPDEDAEAEQQPRIPTQRAALTVLSRYKRAHGADAVAALIRDEFDDDEVASFLTAAAANMQPQSLDELLDSLAQLRSRV